MRPSLQRMLSISAAGLVAAGLAAGSAAAQPERSSSPTAKRLNVVMILSDDERVDGQTVMKNVHQLLAKHGVTFTNTRVTTSMCGPSRASILQGQYSHTTGVLENFGLHSYQAFDESSDLAVWLHDSGYRTALVGKYLNDYPVLGDHEVPPGWDVWQALDSVPLEKYYDYTINDNGRLVHYGTAPSDYSTSVLTRKATNFIRHASSSKPFFLYFAPVTPHLPAIPAKQDQGKLENIAPLNSPAINETDISDKPWRAWHHDLLNAAARLYENHVHERQLESLLSLNRSVKQIVDSLRARGMLDNTVILYTSDNGFLYGEHRLGGKIWPYEESTRVPLVVRTPWPEANGTINREPILNIDFASTITDLAGIEPGKPQDGRSFVPFLHGDTVPWRTAYLIEYLGRSALRVGGPPPYSAIHTARYLYIEYQNGWRELYDLRHDPWELRNVAGNPDYAALQSSLAERLHQLEATPPHPRA